MVEIPATNYDYDSIPLVHASLVTIDWELTEIAADNVIVDNDELEHIASQDATEAPSQTIIGFISRAGEEEDVSRTETTSLPSEASTSVVARCPCVRSGPSISNDPAQQDENPASFSSSPTNDETVPSVDHQEQSRTFGAGAAGAVLGMMLGGPLLSVVLGVVAAFYAQEEGATGDIARALGDIAIVARARFLELDEKHHLVEKGKQAATGALRRLKHRADRNPDAKAKVQRFVGWCWKSLVEFENQHKLIQRGSIKAKEHLDSLVEQYATRDTSTTTSSHPDIGTNESGTNFASIQ